MVGSTDLARDMRHPAVFTRLVGLLLYPLHSARSAPASVSVRSIMGPWRVGRVGAVLCQWAGFLAWTAPHWMSLMYVLSRPEHRRLASHRTALQPSLSHSETSRKTSKRSTVLRYATTPRDWSLPPLTSRPVTFGLRSRTKSPSGGGSLSCWRGLVASGTPHLPPPPHVRPAAMAPSVILRHLH